MTEAKKLDAVTIEALPNCGYMVSQPVPGGPHLVAAFSTLDEALRWTRENMRSPDAPPKLSDVIGKMNPSGVVYVKDLG